MRNHPAMVATHKGDRTNLRVACWLVLALLLLISVGWDVRDVAAGGSVDMRNRIVGARVFAIGQDPYRFQWHAGEPEGLYDPLRVPAMPFSRTTVTPSLLVFYLPLADMPYRTAQFIWLFLQWACLLGSAFLWWRRLQLDSQRLWLMAFLTAFTFTSSWRLHAERGQYYIVLSLLFAWWAKVTLESTNSPRWTAASLAGLLAALLALIRPQFLILAPFLLLHRPRQLPAMTLALIIGGLAPCLLFPTCWQSFFSSMTQQAEFYSQDKLVDSATPDNPPPTIEGVPSQVMSNGPLIGWSHFSIYHYSRRLGLPPYNSSLITIPFCVLFGLWLVFSRFQPEQNLLLGLAVWLFLSDVFGPAPRVNYEDVLIINVIALQLGLVPSFGWAMRIFFLALPFGIAGYYLKNHDVMMTYRFSTILTLGAVWALVAAFRNAGIARAVEPISLARA